MKIEDYNKYYIQGSDHYLIPKDVFKELFNEMINWKEESQKQKEVINSAIEYVEHRIVEDDYMLRVGTDMVQKELLDILKEVSE